ncbi:MAG: C39 family peptidase [Coriobacteriia bacterium]
MRGWTRGFIAVVALASLLSVGLAHGAPPPKQQPVGGALLDDPHLTDTERKKLNEQCLEKEAAFGIERRPVALCRCLEQESVSALCLTAVKRYGYQSKYVPCYKQERTYWCGPAAVRQSLYWHKAVSGSAIALPSQTTLASRIGTTTSGSTTSGIARALNSYRGTFGTHHYVASDISNTSDPLGVFYNRIGAMLASKADGTVPIVLLQTSQLSRCRGHSSRHYVTISGIDDRSVPVRMRDVDPNWRVAYRGIYWDDVGCTTYNGLFRACYQADLEGSNLAMAW